VDVTDVTYEAPVIRDLGSLEELTQQAGFTKIGDSWDVFSSLTSGAAGSLIYHP
jgi:hypothetical protein